MKKVTDIKELINPLLFAPVNIHEVEKVADTNPKYNVGEVVDLETWGGGKYGFTVEDVKITYHNRCSRYTWGYKLHKDGESTGFNFEYIPEGYLRKREEN